MSDDLTADERAELEALRKEKGWEIGFVFDF